jgi:hypothetical protein
MLAASVRSELSAIAKATVAERRLRAETMLTAGQIRRVLRPARDGEEKSTRREGVDGTPMTAS